MKKSVLLLATLISATVFLGCGSSDDSKSEAPNGNDVIVTGVAKCDQASLQKAVESWSEANGQGKATLPDTPGAYQCADGWAVTFPNIGTGEAEVTVTAIFEAEGQFWIPKDRAKVCGKSANQSEVPKPLYKPACLTN